MNIFTDHEIEYAFKRRRYGSRACGTTRFFTWLLWRRKSNDPGAPWKEYGDPWPYSRVSKVDIVRALARIRLDFLILPGSRSDEAGFHGSILHLHTGRDVRVIDKAGDVLTVVMLDDEHGQEFAINLVEYPGAVVEVL